MYSRHFLRRLHKMFNRCTSYSLYSSYLIFLWALLPETCYITLHCEKMLPWYYVYLCLKTFFYDKTKRFKRIIVSYIYSNATRSAVFDKSPSIHHFFFVVLYYREQILLQVLLQSLHLKLFHRAFSLILHSVWKSPKKSNTGCTGKNLDSSFDYILDFQRSLKRETFSKFNFFAQNPSKTCWDTLYLCQK